MYYKNTLFNDITGSEISPDDQRHIIAVQSCDFKKCCKKYKKKGKHCKKCPKL